MRKHRIREEQPVKAQLTVRLPDDLDREITAGARRMRLKRADVVRMALEQFFGLSRVAEPQAPYERIRDLVGTVESGIPDLGEMHREHVLARLRKRA
jgi:hypothetical protein